jgi:hypothetical protein
MVTTEQGITTTNRRERAMSRVTGFTIFNKETGQKLATLPLTIPIGATVEAYERDGQSVGWGWEESNE